MNLRSKGKATDDSNNLLSYRFWPVLAWSTLTSTSKLFDWHQPLATLPLKALFLTPPHFWRPCWNLLKVVLFSAQEVWQNPALCVQQPSLVSLWGYGKLGSEQRNVSDTANPDDETANVKIIFLKTNIK